MIFKLMVDSTDQVDLPCGVQQHFDFDAKKFARLLTFTIWLRATQGLLLIVGTLALLPLQLGAAQFLPLKGRWGALWREIPTPSIELFS
jgi:hypothetical protein